MFTDGMPYLNGNAKWQCMFSRRSLVTKFFGDPENQVPMATEAEVAQLPSGATEADVIALDGQLGVSTEDMLTAARDDRAMFYAGVGGGLRQLTPEKQITGFTNGLSIVKWTNYRTNGTVGNNENYYDTDIPLFRYAEVLLTRAEANFRLGHPELAVPDIDELRGRAHASTVSTEDITEDFLIDEWSREFFVEGRRRSDLVRFGRFSTVQSKVQMPVGPAPMISTVSSSVISEIRAAQNPVARTSPTKRACSSLTASGMRFNP